MELTRFGKKRFICISTSLLIHELVAKPENHLSIDA
jgi:hypothetical protein